jgi:hypothetical protein
METENCQSDGAARDAARQQKKGRRGRRRSGAVNLGDYVNAAYGSATDASPSPPPPHTRTRTRAWEGGAFQLHGIYTLISIT